MMAGCAGGCPTARSWFADSACDDGWLEGDVLRAGKKQA